MLRNGLKSRRPKKTLLLLKRHTDARLKFVRQHKEKEISFWERVLWTDETKIELFIEIIFGGKMVKPTHQRIRFQLLNLAVEV